MNQVATVHVKECCALISIHKDFCIYEIKPAVVTR